MNQPLLFRLLRGDLAVVFYMSLLRFLLHVVVNLSGGYGLFRDELYYLACTDHLAAGYVDQPPLSVYILFLGTGILGDSLFAIRFIPAVAAAFTVYITGLIAIRLGGGKFAQFLACLCAFSFISLAMSTFYSMNSLDILCWTLITYLLLRIIQDENKMLWVTLGIVLGLGLLNKIGVLFVGVGLFAGLVFTQHRKWLRTPWPYIAGVIAFILFTPYILWNLGHDLAHLEFIRNASSSKYAGLSAVDFLMGQFLQNNPVAVLVWLPGLLALFFHSKLKPYRLLGFLYLGPFVIFMINGTSKPEYLAPAYAGLWAVGAVWMEKITLPKRVLFATRAILAGLIICSLCVLLPMVLPVLPVETYISYASALGFAPDSSEGKELAELPQFYADMFGWEQKAKDVASVYNTLTPEERTKCAIYGSNYGRCGAIDYYGEQYGLPKAIGNHNNYWIWGPRGYTGELMIIMGGSYEDHATDFESVTLAATSDCQYCMPYEDNMRIFLCRNMKVPLANIWNEEKHFE